MKYPKIETVFNRDQKTFKVKEDEIRLLEFSNVKNWWVTEKIDGTNIRVIFHKGERMVPDVIIAGRTDKAQIPKFLLEYLEEIFTVKRLRRAFSEEDYPSLGDDEWCVILYGEGYGARIQKGGGRYRQGVSFRLFDVRVGDWWLEPENMKDVAIKMQIETVPVIGVFTLEDAVAYVKSKPRSFVAQYDNGDFSLPMEGIVAQSHPLMLRRNGQRVIWKLKQKDFP